MVEVGHPRVTVLLGIERRRAVGTSEVGQGTTWVEVGDAIVVMVIVGLGKASTARKIGRRKGVMTGNDMMLPSRRRQALRQVQSGPSV